MSRAERVCAALPSWALRFIIASPLKRAYWAAAYLELWKREVADEVLVATADTESGPWACVMPRGFH